MPNVVGKRVCDAMPLLASAGLVTIATPASQIAWIVSKQRPAAGRPVPSGTVEALSLTSVTEPTTPLSKACLLASHLAQTSAP